MKGGKIVADKPIASKMLIRFMNIFSSAAIRGDIMFWSWSMYLKHKHDFSNFLSSNQSFVFNMSHIGTPTYGLLLLFGKICGEAADYWSESFDSSKECISEDQVKSLSKSTDECKSVRIRDDGEKETFILCKTYLFSALQKKCETSRVKDASELLYCKERGVIHCCVKNEKCDTFEVINKNIYVKAKEYLNNTTGFINNLVESVGYKTFHPLKNLDATNCATDCKDQEDGEFAQNCTKSRGLFKCRIRRDKRFCHECRFCCTLPMCVKIPGGKEGTHFEKVDLKLEVQENTKTAGELFFSNGHRSKSEDYYCLKPEPNKDPKKWEQYQMEKYRELYTQEMLESVPTFKFDKRLNNFDDPKVLKSFTQVGKKSLKAWEETYNLWMSRIPSFYSTTKKGFICGNLKV